MSVPSYMDDIVEHVKILGANSSAVISFCVTDDQNDNEHSMIDIIQFYVYHRVVFHFSCSYCVCSVGRKLYPAFARDAQSFNITMINKGIHTKQIPILPLSTYDVTPEANLMGDATGQYIILSNETINRKALTPKEKADLVSHGSSVGSLSVGGQAQSQHSRGIRIGTSHYIFRVCLLPLIYRVYCLRLCRCRSFTIYHLCFKT